MVHQIHSDWLVNVLTVLISMLQMFPPPHLLCPCGERISLCSPESRFTCGRPPCWVSTRRPSSVPGIPFISKHVNALALLKYFLNPDHLNLEPYLVLVRGEAGSHRTTIKSGSPPGSSAAHGHEPWTLSVGTQVQCGRTTAPAGTWSTWSTRGCACPCAQAGISRKATARWSRQIRAT